MMVCCDKATDLYPLFSDLPIQLFSLWLSYRCQDAAIDVDDLPVNKVTGFAGEKDRHPCQVFRITPSTSGSSVNDKFVEWMTIHPDRGGLVCCKIAGPNAVYLNIVFCPFRSHIAGQHFQASLGCSISNHIVPSQLTHHGTNVDDFTMPSLDHAFGHPLGQDER